MKNLKLSVVIPAYNEEKNIKNTLTLLNEYLKKNFSDFEIIVINDGSTDKTEEIIKELGFARLFSEEKNRGKGYAVKKGILNAEGDCIFFTDADLSYSPEYIKLAAELMQKEKTDCICGKRFNLQNDYPPLRRLLSITFQNIVSAFLKLEVKDTQCGFKGFSKKAAETVFPFVKTNGFGFDFEALYYARLFGFSASEISVRFSHSEKSHVRIFKDSADMLFSLLKIKFRSVSFEKNI